MPAFDLGIQSGFQGRLEFAAVDGTLQILQR